jgi:hypothetical protein
MSREAFATIRLAMLYYLLTSLVVVLAILAAFRWILPPGASPAEPPPLLLYFASWDGQAYKGIIENGYFVSEEPGKGGNVAFFPAYPLLAWLVLRATGCPPDLALVLTSNACLAGAFVVVALYLRRRRQKDDPAVFHFTLLALGLLPTTFFFRVAYSESLLVLLTALLLYALEARWPLFWVALIIGLATAVRPVGLGLLLPFALYVWQHSGGVVRFAARFIALLPVACGGMVGYLLYQALAFHDALAFAHSQMIWHNRPTTSLGEKLIALATLRPFWELFVPSSPCYCGKDPNAGLFSLYAANPIFFALAIFCTGVGAWKRWLSSCEVALAAALLFIPYVTRSHEMCMASGARFAAVVVPTYLVMGHLLARLPRGVAVLLLVASGGLLAIYSARFALGHAFFY